MYPYYAVFSEDRRASDESRFWFHDGMHWPEPYAPFDALLLDSILVAFNQASTRLFVAPASLGVECRVLNGYVYLSTNSVTDEATLAGRKELFARRGGYYYEHWDALYESWRRKVEQAIRSSRARGARPAGGRRRIGRHRGTRLGIEPCPPCRVRPPARDLRPDLAVPLRVPQPRLRGVPRSLRALPACPARDHRPDDRQDGLGDRRPALAAGRRAQATRPTRDRARGGRNGRGEHPTKRSSEPPRDRRLRGPLAGRLRRDEEPVVLLLVRERPLPPPSVVDRRHGAADRDDRLLHRAPRRR